MTGNARSVEMPASAPDGPPAGADAAAVSGPWNARRDALVWLILAVYLVVAIASSYIHELGYGPDETSRHLPYIEWLAQKHCIPPVNPRDPLGPLQLHPPLYYALLTPVYLAAKPFGRRAALRALRWTSPPLVGLSLLLWFSVIRRACADDRRTTLFAFALTAWWPNLYVDAATLNNDVGAILASACVLYLIVCRHWRSRDLVSAALWGAASGVGGLLKASVPLATAPLVLVGLVWQHGRRFWAQERFWMRGFVSAAACLALCGWWFVRSLGAYGSVTGFTPALGYSPIPAGMSKLDALASGLVVPLVVRAVKGLWMSVFAGVVWFPESSRPAVYGILLALTVLAVAGVVVGIVRLVRRRARWGEGQAPAIILSALGFGVIYVSAVWVSVFVHAGFYEGGRYLMPFLSGLTIPFALGLKQVCPRPARTGVMIAVALFFLALNFLVWYHLSTYWNPYVLRTAGPFH